MRAALLGLLLAIAPSTTHADETAPIRAGVWQKTVHFAVTNIDGKMIAQTDKTQQTHQSSDCFTAEDVEDPALFFTTDPAAGCDGLVTTASDGVINVSGGCTFNGIPFTAVGHGKYTGERYDEAINLSAIIKEHQVAAEGIVTGEYLHDCP